MNYYIEQIGLGSVMMVVWKCSAPDQNTNSGILIRNNYKSLLRSSKSGSKDEALGLRSGNPHQDGNPGVGKATGFYEKRCPTKRTSNQKLSISAHFGFRIKEKCKTVHLVRK